MSNLHVPFSVYFEKNHNAFPLSIHHPEEIYASSDQLATDVHGATTSDSRPKTKFRTKRRSQPNIAPNANNEAIAAIYSGKKERQPSPLTMLGSSSKIRRQKALSLYLGKNKTKVVSKELINLYG